MRALNAEIKAIRPDLLICVDHEGGRVQRFRTDGFTRLPSMRTLGELWMRDPLRATQAAVACGRVLAGELRACGVDFSFAPVLDLDYGESSVIGDRSFHRDPRVVALLATQPDARAAAGRHGQLRQALSGARLRARPIRMSRCRSTGAASRPSSADDARPYDWLTGTLAAVMPAHVIYPKVDARPAGFSREVAAGDPARQAGLRRRGVQRRPQHGGRRASIDGRLLSYTDAALAALDAGCDLALLCNQSIGREALALDASCSMAWPRPGAGGGWRPDPAAARGAAAASLPRGRCARTGTTLMRSPPIARRSRRCRSRLNVPSA